MHHALDRVALHVFGFKHGTHSALCNKEQKPKIADDSFQATVPIRSPREYNLISILLRMAVPRKTSEHCRPVVSVGVRLFRLSRVVPLARSVRDVTDFHFTAPTAMSQTSLVKLQGW